MVSRNDHHRVRAADRQKKILEVEFELPEAVQGRLSSYSAIMRSTVEARPVGVSETGRPWFMAHPPQNTEQILTPLQERHGCQPGQRILVVRTALCASRMKHGERRVGQVYRRHHPTRALQLLKECRVAKQVFRCRRRIFRQHKTTTGHGQHRSHGIKFRHIDVPSGKRVCSRREAGHRRRNSSGSRCRTNRSEHGDLVAMEKAVATVLLDVVGAQTVHQQQNQIARPSPLQGIDARQRCIG